MSKRTPSDRLIEKILSCREMLHGSIVRINARCGKKGCKCERGQYHGFRIIFPTKKGAGQGTLYSESKKQCHPLGGR